MSYQAPDEACARRREALEAASAGLLARLCGPGDFLPASRRTAVVREALATAGCATCRALHGANKAEAGPEALRQIETDHSFAEPLCRGDLGSLVHELANHQRRLDETWHAAAAERLWDVLTSVGEVHDSALAGNVQDEKRARLAELIDVVAASVGLQAFHRALGQEGIPQGPPPIPTGSADKQPHFSCLREFLPDKRLLVKKSFGWGPVLPWKDVDQKLLFELGMPPHDWSGDTYFSPMSPWSKWSAAPLTAGAFSEFARVAYVPLSDFTQIFKPLEGRVLSRGDLELAAEAYTDAVGCGF